MRSVPNQEKIRRSKVDDVYESLQALAASSGPGSKFPPVRTLAETYDVSLATLTLALDRLESDGIIRRRAGSGVFAAGEDRTGEVCILAEPTVMLGASPFWAHLLRCLSQPLIDQGITPDFHMTKPYLKAGDRESDPLDLLPDAVRRRVESGAIRTVLSVAVESSVLRWIENQGVTVVSFDSQCKYTVVVATLEACQIGVNELIRLGCKRIAVWSGLSLAQNEIFNAALAAHTLEAVVLSQNGVEDRDQRSLMSPPDLINHGYESCLRAFDVPEAERPDGALSLSGTFALGLIMALNKLGVSLGNGFQIATPVNKGVPTLRGWEDQLVRMEFDPELIASVMLEIVEMNSNSGSVDDTSWSKAIRAGGGDLVQQIRPKLIRPKLNLTT